MDYQKFKKEVLNALLKRFPDYEIRNEVYYKNNRKVDGIAILIQKNIAPTFDLNSFYEDNLSINDVIKSIEDTINNKPDNMEDTIKVIMTALAQGDYSKIVPVFLNKENNEELLKSIVYREWLDLVIAYKLIFDGASVTIKKDLLKQMNLTEEELYNQAINNLKPMLFSVLDTMVCITNENQYFGAASILDTAELERLSEDFNDDLYLVPSSVHECIILPTTHLNIDYIKQSILEVNTTVVSIDDFLSNSLYKYSRNTQEITKI